MNSYHSRAATEGLVRGPFAVSCENLNEHFVCFRLQWMLFASVYDWAKQMTGELASLEQLLAYRSYLSKLHVLSSA